MVFGKTEGRKSRGPFNSVSEGIEGRFSETISISYSDLILLFPYSFGLCIKLLARRTMADGDT